MVNDVVINPRVIYVSSTTPADLTAGKLWFNTSDNKLYASDGATYNDVLAGIDLADLNNDMLQNAIAILKLEANATLAVQNYDTMFLDIFSDSGGYSNTINTGNTTASYRSVTDVYDNTPAGSPVVSTSGASYSGTQSLTAKAGMKVTPSADVSIVSITKSSLSTATTGYITNSSDAVLTSGTFSGDVCTFATPYELTASTQYIFQTDSGGSARNLTQSTTTFPVVDGAISWDVGRYNGGDTAGQGDEVLSCVYTPAGTPANKIIETNAITIPANPVAYQLYAENTLAGTGTVTYDIKIGSNSYQTGKSLDTKYVNTDTGSTATLKINLNGTGSGNTANASNYALMVFT